MRPRDRSRRRRPSAAVPPSAAAAAAPAAPRPHAAAPDRRARRAAAGALPPRPSRPGRPAPAPASRRPPPAPPRRRRPRRGDDLERLRRGWTTVVTTITERNRAAKPLISACRPIGVDGNVVTLGFPEEQGFLKDVAERRRPLLETTIGEFLGRDVGVRCVATNLDLVPPLPDDQEAAHVLAEAQRIFAEDRSTSPRSPDRRRTCMGVAHGRDWHATIHDGSHREEPRTWAWGTCSAWRCRCSRRWRASRPSSRRSTVDGSAGGGVVTATVTGKQELVSLTIDPSAVDPADVEMLQDLVVAAVNDALRARRSSPSRRWGRSPPA